MIHLELLVEDISGKIMLDNLLPMILQDMPDVTYVIHPYKGIGRVPKNLKPGTRSKGRMLLDELPKLLNGYGKTFANWPSDILGYVILVCDLDDKNIAEFENQLLDILHACIVQPEARFCFAIEEGEAWLLGDFSAVKAAYPNVQKNVLLNYKNDAVCGTWELLANALSFNYKTAAWYEIGKKKAEWAEHISPYMHIDENNSPSFQYFVKTLRELVR